MIPSASQFCRADKRRLDVLVMFQVVNTLYRHQQNQAADAGMHLAEYRLSQTHVFSGDVLRLHS